MTVDRRSVLEVGLVAAAAGYFSLAAAAIAAAQASSKTYVLVHGAWHGGWCWKEVAEALRGMGHRVSTPTQTGLGERKHLLSKDITLDTFAVDIVNHIEAEELNGVILVGHSFGGTSITGAADKISNRIRHLVYLDSVILENGQSLFSVLPPDLVAARRKTVVRAGAKHLHPSAASDRVRHSREPRLGRLGKTPPYATSGQHVREPDADQQSCRER
jgi:pimeloyl-ACP methyl ester carboxylesterase